MFKICLTVLMFLGLFVGQSDAVVFGRKSGGGPSVLYIAPEHIRTVAEAARWVRYADVYFEELYKLAGVDKQVYPGVHKIGFDAEETITKDDIALALGELKGLLCCIFEGKEFELVQVKSDRMFALRREITILANKIIAQESNLQFKKWFEGLDSLSALGIRANQVQQERNSCSRRLERARRVVMGGAVVSSIGFAWLHSGV